MDVADEIIVVDDGSSDRTAEIAESEGAIVFRHPYNIGNGAAIKRGARLARGKVVLFMDADGQHDPADIPRLVARLDDGYDMVVGARDKASQANIWRSVANGFYNRFASYMTGQPITDLTSGFRAVRAKRLREFIYLLPNGFSYPTTLIMAFFRAGYTVAFEPIHAGSRQGSGHIRILFDGLRFLLIIFKVGTLYSPLKVFFPLAFGFLSSGLGWYAYTFATSGRFTNMSAVLIITGILVFAMGLLSEQITALMYKDHESKQT